MSNKSEKLANQITALKTELSAARAREKEATAAAARRDISRAIRVSGLLGLVTSGILQTDALEREFRAIADHTRTTRPLE